jgi:Xaa-Pro aminopeptidase
MADDLAYQRLQRLRSFLSEAPFEVFIAASPPNVLYASGYRSVAGQIMTGHRMAALVTPEEIYLVGPCADSAPALEAGIDPDRYVAFGRFFFESEDGQAAPTRMVDAHGDFLDALSAAIEKSGVRSAAIGVDELGLGADVLNATGEAVSGVELRHASAWAREVRARKLPGEIDRLRRAAQLAEDGIEAAIASASPGVTERQLASAVAATMASGGAEPRFVVVTGGLRSALADAHPTDNPWKPGELMRFDVGCTVDGYWSDMARTAVLGEPDATQGRRYHALLAGQEAQLSETRPGTSGGRLFEVAVDTVRSEGIEHYRRQHCGHGIGTEVYELPPVAPGESMRLAEGMVLSLETPYYELGWGGMMVEDIVAVTNDGFTPLTRSSRELLTVPA